MGHAPGAKEAASKPAASPSGRGPPLYHWRDVVAARTLALKRSASTGCTGARRSASADRPKATEARTANLAPVSSERKTPVPNVSRPKGFSSRKSETGREKEKDRELNIAVRTRPTGSFGYSTRSFDYQKRRGVDSPGVGSYAASPDTLNAKKDHRQGGPEPLGASHGEEQLTDACVYKGAMVFSRQRPTGTAGPGTYEWSRSDFDLLGAKRSHNVKYQRQVRAGATAGRTDARVVRRVPPSHGMPPSFTSLVQGDRDGREASPTSSGPHLPASTRSKSAPSPLRLSTAIPETVKELSLHSARGTREGSPSNSAEPSTTLSLFATRAHSRSSLRKTPRKRRGHGFGFSQLEATLPPLGSPHEGEGERQAREGVARFLEDLNLSAYVQVLFEEGYDDLRSLVTLTESDCVRLGLLKGHRARLLQAVAQLPAQDAGYSTGIRSHSVSPAQSASLSPRREVQVIELHASTEDMS